VVTKIAICEDEDYTWGANGETYFGSDGDQNIVIKGEKCDADQQLILTVIPSPTIEIIDIACGEKNNTGHYTVDIVTNGGYVNSDYGTPIDNGNGSWTIDKIENGKDITVTVMNENKCKSSIDVKAPYCACIEFDFDYTNVSCYGANDGTITINYVTDGSYVYVNGDLYNSEMLYEPGTYTIEVYTEDKNEDCTITEKINIEEPNALSAEITKGFSGNEPDCGEDNMLSVDTSGGTGLRTYQWNLSTEALNNGWVFSENTDTTAEAIKFNTGYGQGEITVNITDENGCMTVDSIVFIAKCDPTKPVIKPRPISVNLFPNPVRDVLNVVVNNSKDINVEVFDLLGKKVLVKSFMGNRNGRKELKLDFSKFNGNLYYLKIKTDDGIKVKKVILNK
ncbi:MAG: T9SS type A sorting domain-containing protein, partial [Flavobacteriaceae bacterium]|nr:T9SS type A sorting domain-containing protein [Flavobacteriaceae bacterium]